MSVETETFKCFTCENTVDMRHAVTCCGCEQQICADCNDRNKCACDLLRLVSATALVN